MTYQTVVKKLFKLVALCFVLLLILVISLLLFIRSPWGQSLIVNKATDYVSNKTNTTVDIQRLFITFDGNLYIEKLYLDDEKGDTLIYAHSIEASVEFMPLISSEYINVDFLEWDGLKANVIREENSEEFNFNFLIDAFASPNSVSDTSSSPTPIENRDSEPLNFSIGTIHLSNFSIHYNDHFLGLNSKLVLDDLFFKANKVDIEQLKFEVEELKIKGTQLSYLQTKAFAESEESTDSILPHFIVKHLSLDSVQVDYQSKVDQLSSKAVIQHFSLDSTDLNLNDQTLKLNEVLLDNSSFRVIAMAENNSEKDSVNNETAIEWPDWNVQLNRALFSQNSIEFRTSMKQDVNNQFNYDHLDLSGLDLDLANVSLQKDELSANLQSFSFKERSNFKLQDLAFQLNVTPKNVRLNNFKILTPNNRLEGKVILQYISLNDLVNQNLTNFSVDFPSLSLNAKDAFYFAPELQEDTLLMAFTKHSLVANFKASGTSQDLQVDKLVANWGPLTRLNLTATLKHYNNEEKLQFRFNDFRFSSSKKDLLVFVQEEDLGIRIPKSILISGNASGNTKDLTANASLKIPEGELSVKGNFLNQRELRFKGVLTAKELAVGKLLQNSNLGLVSLSLDLEGQGKNMDSLKAKFNTNIKKLELFQYDYSDLELSGNLNNNQGEIEANFKDYNLNAKVNSSFTLDSLESKVKLEMNLIGADLNALGWSEKNIKTAFDLDALFEGNGNDFTFNTTLTNDVTVFDQKPYSLGTVNIDATNSKDRSAFKVVNDFFNINFNSNSSYDKVVAAFESQLDYYFSKKDSLSSSDSVKLNLNLTLKEAPVITEVIAPELTYDSVQLDLNFNQANHFLQANLFAPQLSYQGSSMDKIDFVASSNEESLAFDFRFEELNAAPIKIPRTELKGELKDQIAFVDFKISNEIEKLMHVKSELKLSNDTISYHINPDSLLLNRKDWTILEGNRIQFSDLGIIADNFNLSRNGQNLKIDSRKQDGKDIFELLFNDFKLSTFTNFLNTEDSIASGIVNGDLVFENPLEEMGIISNLTVSKLKVMKIPLGTLEFNSVSQKNEEYKLDLSLIGNAIDLTLNGDYIAKKTEGLLDFSLDLKRLELKEFEKLTSDYLTDLQGSIAAQIKLNGTTQTPNYRGNVDFKSTSFIVNTLNAPFKLPDEGITFDKSKIILNDFLIQDSQNNAFHLDGNIFTADPLNPSFNLTLKANEFQVLNSTVEDNEEFYGKVNFNTDLTIKGDLIVPIIRGNLAINDNSNFTYVVPEDELDLVERDGVIVFVNKKNPDAILTRVEENESGSATITGFDLSTNLKVGKEVDFNIVIDQRSGDNLKIKGNGDFKLGLEPNGRTNFSGKYEVSDGYYEASLYNIVNRRFEIAKGSNIIWRGNPLDADMDIRAIYEVETQASSLMASKTSGQGIAIENDFRKKLPFLVYLNFDGELLKPEISFTLDMPEASQGELGGQVYSRVKQLNTQESELHKQVFSLLVLNQFFPTTSNDGSSGGSADLARGNVNKVLEDQLNNFSDKYLGKAGVELDFGVDSYTDNQGSSAQTKTQLDLNAQKKLFNDQLIVSVGSGVSIEENSGNNQATTPVVGNISLEYIFSEDGTWRIKGFRKNEFESVIEGQLIVTGVSLIYQKEFNKFRELVEQIQKQNESEKKKSP